MNFPVFLAASATALLIASCAPSEERSAHASKPWAADPVEIDADFPPSMAPFGFDSDGDHVNGIIYMANGAGPHPTVVLLHGYPGNERNLDIAHALRRAGFNVIFFHYRGAWASEGDFSLTHVIEDVGAALEAARQRADEFRIDPARILLAGHSMGGFAALHGAARHEDVKCVAAFAPGDMGAIGAFWQANPAAAQPVMEDADSLGMLAGWSGEVMMVEMNDNIETFSLTGLASSLADKSVLLVAADKDEILPPEIFHAPMVEAYKDVPSIQLTEHVILGDHAFSWSRVELTGKLIDWASACSGIQ